MYIFVTKSVPAHALCVAVSCAHRHHRPRDTWLATKKHNNDNDHESVFVHLLYITSALS